MGSTGYSGRRVLNLLMGYSETLASFAGNFLSLNTLSGSYPSSIALGQSCSVTANHNLATGYGASLEHYGAVGRAAGNFAIQGDAQMEEAVLRGITTDGSWTELFLDGSSLQLVMPQLSAWSGVVTIVGRRSDALTEANAYVRAFGAKRDVAVGTVRILGAVTTLMDAEDVAVWDVDISADTATGAVRVRVLGEASKAIRWVATVSLTQVRVVVT